MFKPPRLHSSEVEKERHATWLELFFDLVFVVAITQLGNRLAHQLTFMGALQFLALFIIVCWAWFTHTVYSSRFDTDDAFHKLVTFITMFSAVIMTVQTAQAFEEKANGFAAGFILANLLLILVYFRVLYYNPQIKSMAFLYLIGFGLGLLIWIVSLFIDPPAKFWFWGLGMIINLLTPWVGKKRILSKLPLDSSHIPERFGLFTIIVLGECVAAVIMGLTDIQWNWRSLLMSLLAFVLSILIWIQYYSLMKSANYKCSLNSGQPFIYLHIPLLASLAIVSVCVHHMILLVETPTLFSTDINYLFSISISVWLISFFLLQYITLVRENFKIVLIAYFFAILLIMVFLPILNKPVLIFSFVDLMMLLIILIEYYSRNSNIKTQNMCSL